MKSNKGISLLTLIITIVVMIILAGVTIYYGVLQNIDTSYETDRYTEMMNVSEAVVVRTSLNRLSPTNYPYIGTPLTASTAKTINKVTYGEGWHLLTPAQSVELDLESVEQEYIVNYLTGEVVATKPVIFNDKEYYTSDEIKVVVREESGDINEDMYDASKGVNKPVLIEGMIPVRYVGNKWIITNEEDTRWYDYSAENKVWANVMLSDEVTVVGYSNEEVKNASLAELDGREIITSGSMAVWLPRCTTKPDPNSGSNPDTQKYLITYSKLLQDYEQEGYTLNSYFENTSLTGVWISKYDAELQY